MAELALAPTAQTCPKCGEDFEQPQFEILQRDLRRAAATLSPREARYLVDYYYQQQEHRKAEDNQIRSMEGEPHDILAWLARNTRTFENNIKSALGEYSQGSPVGRWAQSQVGIGPVISAGLLAHIDMEKAPVVGHIWNFAGLNPGVEWYSRTRADEIVTTFLGGRHLTEDDVGTLAGQHSRSPGTLLRDATTSREGGTVKVTPLTAKSLGAALARRPWNAQLKTLCWHIGESFVKVSGNLAAPYGQWWKGRKLFEEGQSASGALADQAAAKLERFKIGKGTDAYKAYIQGLLPPAHVHARSKRWVVKLFLSHWHHVAYETAHGVCPPLPYVLAHDPAHAHLIQPPGWECNE